MEKRNLDCACQSCGVAFKTNEKSRKCKICSKSYAEKLFCATCSVSVKHRFLGPIMRQRFCTDCFTKEQRKQDLPKFKDFSSIIKKKAKIQKKDPLSQYSVVKLLGKGASGVVFEVQNSASGSKHALKIIQLSSAFNKDRAINEIGLMQMTSHENIVRLEEAFEFDK